MRKKLSIDSKDLFMEKEKLLEEIRENKVSSLIVLAGSLNGVYSLVVQNWLGLLISLAVIAYTLPDILKDE